jgi:hypothetical protein
MAAPSPLPPLQRNARSLSVAYACFAFCGLYVLAGDMMEAGFAGDISVLIGFWLVPLGLVGVVALVCGTVLALQAPRHPPLLALCLTNAVFIAAVIAVLALEGPLKTDLEPTVKVASWIYVAPSILIPLWWFLIGRPRGGQL